MRAGSAFSRSRPERQSLAHVNGLERTYHTDTEGEASRHRGKCTTGIADLCRAHGLEIPGGFQNRRVIGQAVDLELQLAGEIEHAVVIREDQRVESANTLALCIFEQQV
jgi:hypothetical protein